MSLEQQGTQTAMNSTTTHADDGQERHSRVRVHQDMAADAHVLIRIWPA